ncbi:MAG: phospho-N-acetylmuramoyl-pentapeptide-transferase [Candidatus Riflebacteria bacterium]|nr:phospho-N-acetylmuramoyl-pentapeptide-transferase [Candidatus Riflebacteria bacterium]
MLTIFFGSLPIRIILSLITSFVTAIIIGPRVIANLKLRQIGQTIREEGIQAHKKKAGIPTMGGVIILIPALICCTLWANFNPLVVVTLFALLGTATIGMLDDLTKVIKARSLGLTPRQKLAGQISIGLVVGLVIRFFPDIRVENLFPMTSGGGTIALATSICQTPLMGPIDFGWLYIPFTVFVVVGATNAVNLTDGLDGLAGSTCTTALSAFLVLALLCGSPDIARLLGTAWIPGSSELAVVCASLLGGCLGFLWFNANPAQVFMGDTGSLALGGALGALAVCLKCEIFLGIIGGIFVSEALSVIIQVSYFKYTGGKRIFRMSPIHHHFELAGWTEQKVVARFAITSLLLAILGVSLFAFRIVFT